MKLITNGDSWTFGSEIVAPEIILKYPNAGHVCEYDYYEENDYYRVPRIWPTKLAEYFECEVVNLAWPADDNTSILRRTINYITVNYINKNISTTDLFVIIGWSSPERALFWYKDEQVSQPFRLWPQVPVFSAPAQKKFWEIYVAYMWHPEEYISRFVHDCVQFENFCQRYGIRFLQFNAFYQTPNANIDRWQELDISAEIQKLHKPLYHYNESNQRIRNSQQLGYSELWNTVDSIKFYRKDQPNNTFKSFIDLSGVPDAYAPMIPNQGGGWHPGEQGHKIWAHELKKYIIDNNLL